MRSYQQMDVTDTVITEEAARESLRQDYGFAACSQSIVPLILQQFYGGRTSLDLFPCSIHLEYLET